MSAAEHLAEAIAVGCTRGDEHDHVADHRAEVLFEAAEAIDEKVSATPRGRGTDGAHRRGMAAAADLVRRLIRGKDMAPAATSTPDLVVYRAEYETETDGVRLYATQAAARAYCEALATADGMTGLVSWVPEDSSPDSPEELTYFDLNHRDGDDVPTQTCTGYYVTPVTVPAEYAPAEDGAA